MIWTKGSHQTAKFQTFDCSRNISPSLYFDRLLLLKVCKISANKVQRITSHNTEDWCKVWRKTDLFFQKWQKFGEFWPKHLKVSKICTLIGSFCVKYRTFDLKKCRDVIFHDTESDSKFEGKLTCGLENDMRNLAHFH